MADIVDERKDIMDKLTSLCKRRGFIFQSSGIYGGINGFWDYGPYGVPLRRAVEQLWWQQMVQERPDVVALDSTVICHPEVWRASGHLEQFADMMTDCRNCKKRFRVDQLEDPTTCPECGAGDLTEPREFNLMLKTFVGPVFDEDHVAYLRAETCQPIFVNYDLVRQATRQKLPFGIAQVGKAFRNEITPRRFTFRSREFVQMEMEYFCRESEAMDFYEYWQNERWRFYSEILGFDESSLHIHPHEELAHYAKAALDIEYAFPFGWGELEGIHHRGTFDLSQHQEYTQEDMQYIDHERGERFLPTVVETSCGLDRICLALLCDAYSEDYAQSQKADKEEELRVVMRFEPKIAPVQVAVLPLNKKLTEKAQQVYRTLNPFFRTEFDVTGSIGKRYRRQDEVGTPYCVTIDFDTMEDDTVTIRYRDAMNQDRVAINELRDLFSENIYGV